ncbi:lysophospholipid acyltransferase family protein [Sphingomonas sp. ID0503]|uniref:lysophospholipid acyltransferase family protein n=1 Tax=Sphingomonas sp. ID0503 TaxID=3399691 RepID=UPI003AFAA586
MTARPDPAPLLPLVTVTLVVRIIAMLALLLGILPLHLFLRAIRRPSPVPRIFLSGVTRICGIHPTVIGTPSSGPVLYLANHLSWIDILLMGGVLDARFVAKAEIARWPLIGFLARQNRTIFVEREARRDVRAQTDTVASALARPQPVAIFPEGTTGEGYAVAPFRASLLAAVTPGVTVQPVAIDYGPCMALVRWPKTEGAPHNAMRLIGRRGTIPVTLTLLPPSAPTRTARRSRPRLMRRWQGCWMRRDRFRFRGDVRGLRLISRNRLFRKDILQS